jgi:signal transduction histidine kinase
MNNERSLLRPLQRRWHQHASEPGGALFQGLRIRLTLWYCGVLGAALVLFSVALYFGAQYFLLAPVEADTAMHAHAHVDQWLMFSPDRACLSFVPPGQFNPPPPPQGRSTSEMVACFDQNGSLMQNGNTAQLPPAFLTNTMVKTALQAGMASDMVDGGGTVGPIYRYAQAVPSPAGNGYVGVVLIGESIKAQENALSLLLTLLLSVGGVALLGAGIGGLFLANRALAPARIAWAHQQRFIADASHELRTPLTLLRADAEVLLRTGERMAAEDAELLEDIVAEADHMATLANNMLTLARLDAGFQHREHEVVNLNEVALVGVRRVTALADQQDVAIHFESSNDVIVIGDPVLLEQALLALLDNAIKYNHSGGQVTVRTSLNAGQAQLEVCDTGIGIAAEHLPHLGERFYRVDKARSREAGGTGLGLSIARSIVLAHGGTLGLTSIPEQGTTVTILLPLAHGTPSDRMRDAPGGVSSLPERSI